MTRLDSIREQLRSDYSLYNATLYITSTEEPKQYYLKVKAAGTLQVIAQGDTFQEILEFMTGADRLLKLLKNNSPIFQHNKKKGE